MKTKKLSHLQIFVQTVVFEIFVISTRVVETTENYFPRESKIKVAKCDEQTICLDLACH